MANAKRLTTASSRQNSSCDYNADVVAINGCVAVVVAIDRTKGCGQIAVQKAFRLSFSSSADTVLLDTTYSRRLGRYCTIATISGTCLRENISLHVTFY